MDQMVLIGQCGGSNYREKKLLCRGTNQIQPRREPIAQSLDYGDVTDTWRVPGIERALTSIINPYGRI